MVLNVPGGATDVDSGGTNVFVDAFGGALHARGVCKF
jgi:hypothetical protein